MEKDIKDYREKELRNYVIGNILLALVMTGKIPEIISAIGSEKLWDALGVLIGSGSVAALVYIYVYLIDCIVPGDAKNKIIWFKQGLPGTRVFSEIRKKNKDTRFTAQSVINKYADVYASIDDEKNKDNRNIENEAWYAAYQKSEKSAQVYVANRDWLLCRDMCVMTLWLMMAFIVLCIATKEKISLMMLFFIAIELIVTWIAARVKSRRFVYDVIAKDISYKTEDKGKV